MTKKQIAILISAVIVVLFAYTLSSCGTATTKEVKTDTTEVKVDTATLDTLKQTIMAKSSKVSTNKVSFGKRKGNQTGGVKSYNKHAPKPKQYRGQGR